MRVKITPFSNKNSIYVADLYFENNCYCSSEYASGIVTEIIPGDVWLDGELAWISKSEIPFITTVRHMFIQVIEASGIVSIVPHISPILSEYNNVYKIIERDNFPEKAECRQLLKETIDEFSPEIKYSLEQRDLSISDPQKYFNKIDLNDDLLVRCMTSIHKAYILLNANFNTFGEEIYTNLFKALECLIEEAKLKHNISKEEAITELESLFPAGRLSEIEEEMRDSIRNDIIHPYRDRDNRIVVNPFLMADYIYEDLPFVDYILRKAIETEYFETKEQV